MMIQFSKKRSFIKVTISYPFSLTDMQAIILVFLFIGNYAANTALGVFYVTLVAGDEMHVAVENGLTSSLVDVDTNIVAIWVETFVCLLLDVLQHYIHGLTFVVCKVKV